MITRFAFAVFALTVLSELAAAQTPRVSVLDSGKYERAYGLSIYQDSLLMVVGMVEPNNSYTHGTVTVLDKSLRVKEFIPNGKAYASSFNAVTQVADTAVLFGSSYGAYGGGGYQGLICKWYGGVPICSYSFGGDRWDNFVAGVCDGSNYYGIGMTQSYSEDQVPNVAGQDFYVCKTNGHGELIWQGVYGTPQKDELAAAVIREDRTKILLAGTNRYFHGTSGGEMLDSAHMYFTVVDSAGNQNWSREYRLSSGDNASGACLADDGFYFTGTIQRPGTYDFYPILGKLNADGDTVWIKRYWVNGLPSNTPENKQWLNRGATTIKTLRNGDLLLTGLLYNQTGADAFAARFTAQGDSLWCFTYRTPGADYFKDAVEDDQGYIYVCGYSYVSPATPTNVIDVVLVKLDAFGCAMDTCLMPEVTPPTPTPKPSLPVADNGVFPNPFADALNLQFYQADSTNANSVVECDVYDVMGRRVNRYSWVSSAQPMKIETANWSNGLYIVELKGYGLVERSKAVKQLSV